MPQQDCDGGIQNGGNNVQRITRTLKFAADQHQSGNAREQVQHVKHTCKTSLQSGRISSSSCNPHLQQKPVLLNVALAVLLVELLWRDGFRHSKCGVMILELLPEKAGQPALGTTVLRAPGASLEDTNRLNVALSRGTIRILSAGSWDAAWKLQAERRLQRSAARLDEVHYIKSAPVGFGGQPRMQGKGSSGGEISQSQRTQS